MTEYSQLHSPQLLIDRFGRHITYLRVSVTDRCNLRCVYCMPPEGIPWQSHESILSFEEIAQVVRIGAEHGITEVRLTGGEPLVRKGLTRLVQLISEIPGITSISLTTNGLLLDSMAAELKQAGLKRINVSLDTLIPEKFARITRGGSFEKTWQGIETAEAVRLSPIKLNVVAMRGINDDELLDMARLSLTHPWQVRFIELMPVNTSPSQDTDLSYSSEESFIAIEEIKSKLASLNLEPVVETNGSGPARLYRSPGAPGRVGFISPISEHFCDTCNRLRLTADGHLRACLLNETEIRIREAIKAGEDLLPYMEKAIALKPEGHELSINHMPGNRCMRQIGG